jgi:iron complex outermembrane recepter protein
MQPNDSLGFAASLRRILLAQWGTQPMTCTRLRRVLPICALILPLLIGLSSVAMAQEQSAPQAAPAQAAPAAPAAATAQPATEAGKAKVDQGKVRVAEEVTVTGTMIPRKDLTALSPVAVVDVQEVTYQGTGRVEDLIQQLPQAFAAQNASISNGASGTATVQLRNLGSVRTLSLLNGRRMASGDATGEAAADLNFIPSALVKRVDVLTGGASSVYGADAVAGVVNFVLDTDFQGFRGEVQWNGYQHNNNNQIAQDINKAKGFSYPSGTTWNNGGYNFNLAVGGKFDGGKGHATAFVDYRDISAILKSERDYTACSVGALGADGPACAGSSTWQYGRFIVDSGASYVLDPNTGNIDTFRKRTGADLYNYGAANFMQRNDTKWSGGAFAQYKLSTYAEPYAEVMVMDDYSDAQIAPSGDFATTTQINCDNPMLSDQERAIICTANGFGPHDDATLLVMRRNVEGGNRVDQLRHVNYRLLGGVRGDVNPSWSYDLYGILAKVAQPETYINDMNSNRLQEALFVVGDRNDPSTWQCRSGNPDCRPWNIFTIGGVTPDATDYMATTLVSDAGTGTKLINGSLKGDLDKAGVRLPTATEGVRLVVGGELRKEELFYNPDDNYRFGTGSGQGGPRLPVDGSYVSNEAFTEALVPLVQDKVGMQDLSLELGYRFANYKASSQSAKNNSSYKALLSYAPIQGVKVRGGFNRAVRAPNVRELFVPQGVQLQGTADICAGENPTASLEQCKRTGVTDAQYGHILENPAGQYNSLLGGNPQLDVEKANTITAGVVWTPKEITGLAVTLDFYDIKIDNTISNFFADDTIQSCATKGDPTLCSLIHRDRFGTLWLTPDGYTTATNQNIGTRKARGLDASASYNLNLGGQGFIAFSMLGSSMLVNRTTTPLVNYDCAGYYGSQCGIPSPKWRHRVRATWNTKFNATFSLNWRYIHHVLNDDASSNPDLADPGNIETLKLNDAYKLASYNWFDLAATYKFHDKLRLTVGCNNLLDKEPPLGAGDQNNDYGPGFYGTYDYLGRALFANLQFEF